MAPWPVSMSGSTRVTMTRAVAGLPPVDHGLFPAALGQGQKLRAYDLFPAGKICPGRGGYGQKSQGHEQCGRFQARSHKSHFNTSPDVMGMACPAAGRAFWSLWMVFTRGHAARAMRPGRLALPVSTGSFSKPTPGSKEPGGRTLHKLFDLPLKRFAGGLGGQGGDNRGLAARRQQFGHQAGGDLFPGRERKPPGPRRRKTPPAPASPWSPS